VEFKKYPGTDIYAVSIEEVVPQYEMEPTSPNYGMLGYTRLKNSDTNGFPVFTGVSSVIYQQAYDNCTFTSYQGRSIGIYAPDLNIPAPGMVGAGIGYFVGSVFLKSFNSNSFCDVSRSRQFYTETTYDSVNGYDGIGSQVYFGKEADGSTVFKGTKNYSKTGAPVTASDMDKFWEDNLSVSTNPSTGEDTLHISLGTIGYAMLKITYFAEVTSEADLSRPLINSAKLSLSNHSDPSAAVTLNYNMDNGATVSEKYVMADSAKAVGGYYNHSQLVDPYSMSILSSLKNAPFYSSSDLPFANYARPYPGTDDVYVDYMIVIESNGDYSSINDITDQLDVNTIEVKDIEYGTGALYSGERRYTPLYPQSASKLKAEYNA
jgi:hypothetical protein